MTIGNSNFTGRQKEVCFPSNDHLSEKHREYCRSGLFLLFHQTFHHQSLRKGRGDLWASWSK